MHPNIDGLPDCCCAHGVLIILHTVLATILSIVCMSDVMPVALICCLSQQWQVPTLYSTHL